MRFGCYDGESQNRVLTVLFVKYDTNPGETLGVMTLFLGARLHRVLA